MHEKIANEYKATKLTKSELARKYKVSTSLIYYILEKFGIETERRYGLYNLDEEYFNNVNTPNKAYFLGLFHADGCNGGRYISINLQEGDKHILEEIRKDMKYEGPLKYVIKNKKKEHIKNQWNLKIISPKITKRLVEIGYPKNKTFSIKFPKFLEKNLIRHFIRGIFDGDGCLLATKYNAFNIIGTLDTVEGIQTYFKDELSVPSKIRTTMSEGIFTVNVIRVGHIFKVLSHLYEDAELKLQRKYNIFCRAYLEEKRHLTKVVKFRNVETGETHIFATQQEAKDFFGLKFASGFLYGMNGTKRKLWRKVWEVTHVKDDKPLQTTQIFKKDNK